MFNEELNRVDDERRKRVRQAFGAFVIVSCVGVLAVFGWYLYESRTISISAAENEAQCGNLVHIAGTVTGQFERTTFLQDNSGSTQLQAGHDDGFPGEGRYVRVEGIVVCGPDLRRIKPTYWKTK